MLGLIKEALTLALSLKERGQEQIMSQPVDRSLASALKILQSYSCITPKLITSDSEKAEVQEALLLVTQLAEHQNLGICADDVPNGLAALKSYAQALGYKLPNPSATVEIAPVYIKFNAQKQSYYLDPYPGTYRGVLVSCQSSEYDLLNGTFGHFPLDLF